MASDIPLSPKFTPKEVKETPENRQSRSRSATPPAEQNDASYAEEDWSSPASGENKLRPAGDVINRIRWDPACDPSDYVIVILDRFEGELVVEFNAWKRESTHEEFIPQHRVLYIKTTNGDVVWDRRRRIDKIFHSGNSAFKELAFLS
ncbi:hypothetical protein N7470_003776 [Penicillium chermesinum]|nr:hypothetical protein N7470_003776 [Penicillium chermesinum]